MRELIRKGFLPIAAFAAILIITNEIYMVDGNVDFIRLWMCVGIPFGLVRGRTYLAPFSLDLVYVLGMLLLYFVICGVFGGFFAIISLVQAVLIIINFTIQSITGEHVSC